MRQFISKCIVTLSMFLVVFYGVGINVLPLCCLEEHEHLTLGEPHHCHHHIDCEEDNEHVHQHAHHHGSCCHLSHISLQLGYSKSTAIQLVVPQVFTDSQPQNLHHWIFFNTDKSLTFQFESKAPPIYNSRNRLLSKCCLVI